MPAILQAIGMILMMIVVCALVVFAAYYATKLMGRKYGATMGGSQCMKVIDRLALGPDRMLVIVQAGGKTLLLGVTQHHIETICDIDADQLPEIQQSVPVDHFATMLQNLMHKNDSGSHAEKDDKHDGRL